MQTCATDMKMLQKINSTKYANFWAEK